MLPSILNKKVLLTVLGKVKASHALERSLGTIMWTSCTFFSHQSHLWSRSQRLSFVTCHFDMEMCANLELQVSRQMTFDDYAGSNEINGNPVVTKTLGQLEEKNESV